MSFIDRDDATTTSETSETDEQRTKSIRSLYLQLRDERVDKLNLASGELLTQVVTALSTSSVPTFKTAKLSLMPRYGTPSLRITVGNQSFGLFIENQADSDSDADLEDRAKRLYESGIRPKRIRDY